jgi:cysteine desulfurase/selenocysteine lyase
MLDVAKIKEQFPVFKNNPGLVYLDTTATSLKPQSVIDEMTKYYEELSATVHRGVYDLSFEATKRYDETREKIASFINSPSSDQIVFTRGTTSALNLIVQGYALNVLKPGDEVVISTQEHHSNFIPWQKACKRTGAKLVFVELNKNGEVTLENAKKAINENTKIVSLAHVSNVLGNVTPIKEITSVAHSFGAKMFVDAAQSVPHMLVDVVDLDVDLLAFSAHKMMGPSGLGVLYGKMDILNEMEPVEFGGDMSNIVTEEDSVFKEVPLKFEAGTPLIAEVIGFKRAIEMIEEIGFEAIHEHEVALKKYAVEKLSENPDVIIYNAHNDSGVVTFNIKGIHPHDMASHYNTSKVCVRAGHHCAQPIHKHLNAQSTLRASFYIYNDFKDIDAFVEATQKGDAFLDVLF